MMCEMKTSCPVHSKNRTRVSLPRCVIALFDMCFCLLCIISRYTRVHFQKCYGRFSPTCQVFTCLVESMGVLHLKCHFENLPQRIWFNFNQKNSEFCLSFFKSNYFPLLHWLSFFWATKVLQSLVEKFLEWLKQTTSWNKQHYLKMRHSYILTKSSLKNF